MMKWNKTHRKGTKQVFIMHTESGFTPSIAFLDKYFVYREECERAGLIPAECEEYYTEGNKCNNILRSKTA